MKTIEQRQDELMATLPYLTKSRGGVKGFKDRLRAALREVARDQRQACAETVLACERDTLNNMTVIRVSEAHQAVINTAEPGK